MSINDTMIPYHPSGLVLAMFSQICAKKCASTTRHQSTRSPTHHRLPDHLKFFQWHFVVLWVLKFYFMPTLKTFYSVYSVAEQLYCSLHVKELKIITT